MLSSYVRGDFPGLGRYRVYLNTAAVGLVPRPARDALVQRLMVFSEDPLGVESGIVESLRQIEALLEMLYGIPQGEVAWGESTTHMIARIAVAAAGGGTIAVTEHEFPGVVYALRTYCGSVGCRVIIARGEPEEALEEALDGGADVLVASSVFWVTGRRLDVARLAGKARRRGAYLVVDAIQHLGALPADALLEADAFCASSKKWLLAPHSGLAFCRVSRRLVESAQPPWAGLNNMNVGDRNLFWLDPGKRLDTLPPLRGDAWRFNAPSGIGYLQVAGLEETLRYLSQIPVEAVYEHIMMLRRHLVELLEDAGIGYYRVPEGLESGIILVETGLPPQGDMSVAKILASRGVSVSARGQAGLHGLRVSLHMYNSLRDVDVFVEELRTALSRV